MAYFFAGMVVNVVALVLVFVAVQIVLSLLAGVLDLVGRLPIIRSFNRMGGLAAGLAIGVLLTWVGMTLLSLFLLNAGDPALQAQLDASAVAIWFFENNWLMDLVTGGR